MSLSDRILESFERLTKAFQAKANYAIPWEYAVSEATSTTFTGKATSTDCPHPDLVGIPLMPGVAGTLIKPAVGSLVGVVFLNGDPTRPRVVCWDQNVAEFVGLAGATLDGSIGKPVHRVDDTGTAGSLSAAVATMTLVDANGSETTYLFQPSSGSISITQTGSGLIGTKATTGSGKVSSG